ncbi:hypothetical protein SCALM49S_08946 [Streptomyces californicus]
MVPPVINAMRVAPRYPTMKMPIPIITTATARPAKVRGLS